MPNFRYDNPADALDDLLARLSPVESESVSLNEAAGRVLAEPLVADRDSPPHDVSAMDGYAVRVADVAGLDAGDPALPLAGEVPIGTDPPTLPPKSALRIYTGSCVPHGADAVIQREHTREPDGLIASDGSQRVTITVPVDGIVVGQNIRRRGENLRENEAVIPSGVPINHAVVAALASFGSSAPVVYKRVRAAAIVTGDELLAVDSSPPPWRIRDSNGPTLNALLASRRYVSCTQARHVRDDLRTLTESIEKELGSHELLVLTGGVSMGQHDHVPQAIKDAGGTVLFHRLPIRPGKPILAAIGPSGQAILALPGNPLAVVAASVLFVLPAIRKLAGFADPLPVHQSATVTDGGGDPTKTIPLYWYRPASFTHEYDAAILPSQGSGDTTSAARADGLIELPPNHLQHPKPGYRFFPYHQP